MIDQKFMFPRVPVAVVDIGDALEALLIRATLESLGAVVTLHLPGTPQDFLTLIGAGDLVHQYVVICGHGDDNGFVFGEYCEGIDTSMLVEDSMPPSVIAEHARLDGKVILSTACETGGRVFGDAFVGRGRAALYVGPDGSPEGADAPLFVHCFFHALLARRQTPVAALDRARGYDEAAKMFVGYQSGR
ncbi:MULTISPECIES: hypothetical protein [unclassified Ensifer]|uniref:hypothetical protein n=1 Tax=unclassified Ensifer TaxID=2633371 RepID=UPI000812D9AD|nr:MULTISPECIES: hypothetical protein [unclassified Ensifer]OCP17822.1 hypothetical protein BC361_07585 [Ensifer sp. LC54]OCP28921.1 hypothetical protein BC363_02775 [Ensifer sp. LC384]